MWYTLAIEPTGRREPQWQTSISSPSNRITPTTSSCPSSTAVWSAALRGRHGDPASGTTTSSIWSSPGKGVFEVGGRTYEVTPGDLFFARPSQLIRYTADEIQPWEYSWVGFNGACAHKLAAQLPFTDAAPVHHTQDLEGMRAALSSIYSSRGLQPQDEAAMVGYLYLFISALMRETSESRPHSTSSSSQYVLNAIKYIQFNYSHDISIDDVAKSVGVSRSHLYRVFMLNVGKSPIDYLTEYRVNEACKLLRSGTLSIAEVAASVGFLDQFYFSRVFKRAKGVPPSKYMTSQADADVQPAPDET